MTDYCVGYVEKTKNEEVTIHYGLYATFNESKNALLNIMSTMGLGYIADGTVPPSELHEMANATIALMLMEEDALDPALINETDAIKAFGTQHMLVFIKRGDLSNVRDLVGEATDIKVELDMIADHRKCTPDFCFGSLDTSLN